MFATLLSLLRHFTLLAGWPLPPCRYAAGAIAFITAPCAAMLIRWAYAADASAVLLPFSRCWWFFQRHYAVVAVMLLNAASQLPLPLFISVTLIFIATPHTLIIIAIITLLLFATLSFHTATWFRHFADTPPLRSRHYYAFSLFSLADIFRAAIHYMIIIFAAITLAIISHISVNIVTIRRLLLVDIKIHGYYCQSHDILLYISRHMILHAARLFRRHWYYYFITLIITCHFCCASPIITQLFAAYFRFFLPRYRHDTYCASAAAAAADDIIKKSALIATHNWLMRFITLAIGFISHCYCCLLRRRECVIILCHYTLILFSPVAAAEILLRHYATGRAE